MQIKARSHQRRVTPAAARDRPVRPHRDSHTNHITFITLCFFTLRNSPKSGILRYAETMLLINYDLDFGKYLGLWNVSHILNS